MKEIKLNNIRMNGINRDSVNFNIYTDDFNSNYNEEANMASASKKYKKFFFNFDKLLLLNNNILNIISVVLKKN